MNATVTGGLRTALERILTEPTPADLWRLQGDLLAVGGEAAWQACEVAGQFHGYLRDLESKIDSRRASRLAAGLETASVTSVSLQELAQEREDLLRRIFAAGVTAMLELSAAAQQVHAWEMEAALVHYDVAWYLYGALWRVSERARPELSPAQRRASIDRLLAPVLEPDLSGAVKAALLVKLFQAVLAAYLLPLLADGTVADTGG